MREFLKASSVPAALVVGIGLLIYATSGGPADKRTERTTSEERERIGRLEAEVDRLKEAVAQRREPEPVLPNVVPANTKPLQVGAASID